MQITTTRFGTIEVRDDALLSFPEGLLGFETVQQYCLLEHVPGSPFLWLQATTNPSLAFVTVDPFEFFHEYDVAINDADAEYLRLESPEEVRVLTIVTIGEGIVTTNLVGPIVVNHKLGLARQVVLSDYRYGTRHSLLASPEPVVRDYCEVA